MTFAALALYLNTHPEVKKWLFRAALALLILITLGILYFAWTRHERGIGKVEERKQVVTEVAHDTSAQVQNATTARDVTVAGADKDFSAAAKIIAAQDEAIAAKNQTIAILLGKIEAAKDRAKNTPDAELDSQIYEALGEPANTPHAKRRILEAVSSNDSLSQAVKDLQDAQKEQDVKIGKLGEQIAAKEKERVAERARGDEILGAFTQLYNAQGLKKRGWQCFYTLWIKKCVPDKVQVPKPETFKAK